MTEPRSATSGAVFLACALACGVAWGQSSTVPSPAASAAERAQKETDRTMYWIRVLADKPAPVKAAPAPKPVAAAPAARPATEARQKSQSGSVPTATAAAGRNTAQAPIGDAPEPSALSSTRADNAAAAVDTSAAAPPSYVEPTPAPEPDPGLIQVKAVQPDFPIIVVQHVRKGHVEVQFEVEPGGAVVDAAVVESSNSHLNNAALEAIRQWRFQPTAKSHTAVVNLVFNIDNEK